MARSKYLFFILVHFTLHAKCKFQMLEELSLRSRLLPNPILYNFYKEFFLSDTYIMGLSYVDKKKVHFMFSLFDLCTVL